MRYCHMAFNLCPRGWSGDQALHYVSGQFFDALTSFLLPRISDPLRNRQGIIASSTRSTVIAGPQTLLGRSITMLAPSPLNPLNSSFYSAFWGGEYLNENKMK
jgi:hypothetical protein